MSKNKLTAAAALMMVMGWSVCADAAFDENLTAYTLDNVIVEADAVRNKFGDTVTEQSYYRTGGDVKVITREEIDMRHYSDVTEAIKRVPGVTFQNPGYRGGEYGYQFYNNGVSINGDTRVIFTVDGRRIDNAASTRLAGNSKKGSKATGVNIDQMIGIDDVEKIEVIKGPGASKYGADATGGVINIITRKGGGASKVTVDAATGSWGKHNYNMTIAGDGNSDGTFHYFVSADRKMSQDTKYKDGTTGEEGTLAGSKWREQGINVRLDQEIDDRQSLTFWYNFRQGKDGYPIATPNLKYWNEKDWQRIIFNADVGTLDKDNKIISTPKDKYSGWISKMPKADDGSPLYNVKGEGATDYGDGWVDDAPVFNKADVEKYGLLNFPRLAGDKKNPGYHNLYALDGNYGSFSKFQNNDVSFRYTFDREKDMESYLEIYRQKHHYENSDFFRWDRFRNKDKMSKMYMKQFPNGATDAELAKWIDDNLAPFPGGNPEKLKAWIEETSPNGAGAPNPTSWNEEENRGITLQVAKSVGVNDIIVSVTRDKADNSYCWTEDGEVKNSTLKRNSWFGWIQDKIHASDKWDITPSVRYSKYDGFEKMGEEDLKDKSDVSAWTGALNTEYAFDDDNSMYAGWTKVYRPLRKGDYSAKDGVFKTPLEDEKGDAYTLGVRHNFGENTSLAVHYDFTNMSNAIATLPIVVGNENKSTAVNAKEEKKSFNVTLDHEFDEHFRVSASYSHMKDEWKAKPGWKLDPSWDYNTNADINTGINNLRPQNHYALNMSYQNGKVYTGLLTNWYTGCNLNAFTDKSFLVLDWNINYEVNDELSIYGLVNNLTNEAYETSYNSWNGVGSSAMPGRCFMVGAKYKF